MFRNQTVLLRTLLLLISIETAVAVFTLASIPVDVKNAALFGFSWIRLILIGIPAVLFLFSFGLLVYSFFNFSKISIWLQNLQQSFSFIFWNLACLTLAGILFFLTPSQRIGESIAERLAPIVYLIALLAVQLMIFQFVWYGQKLNFAFLKQLKPAYFSAGITFVIIFLFWIFIVTTEIGLVPEKTGWSPPGTPILPQQVFLALGIGFLFFLISTQWHWIKNTPKIDITLGIILWSLAFFIWLNEPLQDWSYFTAKPTAPNFEIYPYSDAALYDTFAQNYLIGESLQYGLTHRPGYAIFLALLHAIAGQNYNWIVILQIGFLAFAPIVLYLLASNLSNRPTGLLVALLIIFREKNAIALTNIIEVSHSKLLMSDILTMGLTIVFVYFLIQWLQHQENKLHLGILVGASLGLAALVRSQALICIPIVIACLFIAKRKRLKQALIQSLALIIGLAAVTLPWTWRNYHSSGRFVIEYQPAYTKIIASGYTDNPADIEKKSNESIEEYDERMLALIMNYMRENPMEVARFYSAYFVHNEISALVQLPMSAKFFDAPDYVRTLNMWGWKPLFAKPALQIFPLFFLTLGLIALGIGMAYQRAKWIGLLPLFIHLGYSFSVVPFKTSGWRFILPVDWILTLYFCIGLMSATLIAFSVINQNTRLRVHENDVQTYSTLTYQKVIPVFCLFLAIGLSLPVIERMIPQKYPQQNENELIQTSLSNDVTLPDGTVVSLSDIKKFQEQEPNSSVLYGSALYPSYYRSGEFWGDESSYPPELRDISRLQIFLIGPIQQRVYIPLENAPEVFPHGSDVFVLGCKTSAGVQALLVKVNDEFFVAKTPWAGLTCHPQ